MAKRLRRLCFYLRQDIASWDRRYVLATKTRLASRLLHFSEAKHRTGYTRVSDMRTGAADASPHNYGRAFSPETGVPYRFLTESIACHRQRCSRRPLIFPPPLADSGPF